MLIFLTHSLSGVLLLHIYIILCILVHILLVHLYCAYLNIAVLRDTIATFKEMSEEMQVKPYDCLNYRDRSFEVDHDAFRSRCDNLVKRIRDMLQDAFVDVWDSTQGFDYLLRFEKVQHIVLGLDLEEKYRAVIKKYLRDMEKIQKVYVKQCEKPVVPRLYAPTAGMSYPNSATGTPQQ